LSEISIAVHVNFLFLLRQPKIHKKAYFYNRCSFYPNGHQNSIVTERSIYIHCIIQTGKYCRAKFPTFAKKAIAGVFLSTGGDIYIGT